MDLTIECKSVDGIEISHNGHLKVYVSDIQNIDDLAREIARKFDPGLLVTEDSQDLFLDAIETKHIREYLKDTEAE